MSPNNHRDNRRLGSTAKYVLLAAASLSAGNVALAAPGAAVAPSKAVGATAFFPSDSDIEASVRPYVERGEAKGIVVGLIEPDGRRRVLTFGDPGNGARPLGGRSIFELGSITKAFTGILLADMVRRGEVKLDDPVAKYLPADIRVPSFEGRPITLADLATHTSGLPRMPSGYVSPDPANPVAHYAPADLYAFLGSTKLDRAPGSKFDYSNLGMGLLGFALTRAATAESLSALMTERILAPLGMRSTAFGRPRALDAWMVPGHDTKGSPVAPFDAGILAGGGGLSSSVTDMMTFLDANIGEPRSALERAILDAQRGHFVPRPGVKVGLGWMTMERGSLTLVGHNGGTAGYSSYIGFDPRTRAGVVVLSNTGGFEYADKIGRELLNPERLSPSGSKE